MARPTVPTTTGGDVWGATLNAAIYDVSDRVDAVDENSIAGDINGRVPLSSQAPGSVFAIDTNGAGGWTLNGTTITSRPAGCTHLKMVAYGGSSAPSFAISGDIWFEEA